MKFADQPELRKKCFEDHIRNYEDRLLHKKKKVASGLAEAEDADDNNDLDESNNDYEKKVQALNEDGSDDGDDDADDNFVGDNDEELNTESLQDAEQEATNDVEEYDEDDE